MLAEEFNQEVSLAYLVHFNLHLRKGFKMQG